MSERWGALGRYVLPPCDEGTLDIPGILSTDKHQVKLLRGMCDELTFRKQMI
jgi:hypothetical protein